MSTTTDKLRDCSVVYIYSVSMFDLNTRTTHIKSFSEESVTQTMIAETSILSGWSYLGMTSTLHYDPVYKCMIRYLTYTYHDKSNNQILTYYAVVGVAA